MILSLVSDLFPPPVPSVTPRAIRPSFSAHNLVWPSSRTSHPRHHCSIYIEAVVAAPEPAVDPEQMEKSLESALQATQTQAQELINLQAAVSNVRLAQTDLSSQREAHLKTIAEKEAEIAAARASIKTIDASLAENKSKLSELQKTISQKTAKQ